MTDRPESYDDLLKKAIKNYKRLTDDTSLEGFQRALLENYNKTAESQKFSSNKEGMNYNLIMSVNGRIAYAYKEPEPDGLISKGKGSVLVRAGSKVSPRVSEKLKDRYKEIRTELENLGIISDFVFVKDCEFESLSEAATVINGYLTNGNKYFLPC